MLLAACTTLPAADAEDAADVAAGAVGSPLTADGGVVVDRAGADVAGPGRAEPETTAAPACSPAPLEVRAAAVLVVGLPGVTRSGDPLARRVVDLGVGGVFLSESNVRSAAQVTALVAGLEDRADRPLVIATDEESGRVAVTRAVVGSGPSPRTLADRRTPEEVRTFALELGTELHELGVDLDLAPVLDLDDGPAAGIVGDRSFGADPWDAAHYGLAFAAGLDDAGVVPTVKHFPGHGRSSTDTHTSGALVEAGLDELLTTDLVPFQHAIDAGAPVVMLGHLRYAAFDAGLPASLDPQAYALLRAMGFEGVAVTDSLGMGAVHRTWDFPESTVMAITAGADAVLTTDGRQAERMRDALVAAVADGVLPEARLSEAAARTTALAGGDPWAMSCLDVRLPTLDVVTGPAGAVPAPGT